MTTVVAQADSQGRRLLTTPVPPVRLAVAGGLLATSVALGATTLLGGAAVSGWLVPLAAALLALGLGVSLWPAAAVRYDDERRLVRLPGGRRLRLEEVRAVVLFTAVQERAEPCRCAHARSVYVLTAKPPRKRSRLRREIARWGAQHPDFARQALTFEAAAASHGRCDDPATVANLLRCRDDVVATALTAPCAWTLARQLVAAADVPLIHHAGHLAVLSSDELTRPLLQRLHSDDTPVPAAPDTSPAPGSMHVETSGGALHARWLRPRLPQPAEATWLLAGVGVAAWGALLLLGLAEGALAAWDVAAVLMTAAGLLVGALAPRRVAASRRVWGLTVQASTLTAWRGAAQRPVARFDLGEVTDLFVVERIARGLAVATAADYVLLPMSRRQARWLRERLRHHLKGQTAPASASEASASEASASSTFDMASASVSAAYATHETVS